MAEKSDSEGEEETDKVKINIRLLSAYLTLGNIERCDPNPTTGTYGASIGAAERKIESGKRSARETAAQIETPSEYCYLFKCSIKRTDYTRQGRTKENTKKLKGLSLIISPFPPPARASCRRPSERPPKIISIDQSSRKRAQQMNTIHSPFFLWRRECASKLLDTNDK